MSTPFFFVAQETASRRRVAQAYEGNVQNQKRLKNNITEKPKEVFSTAL